MKHKYLLLSVLFITFYWTQAQCTDAAIDRASWTIHSFDTEETNGEGANNGHAIHAIDDDINTFWHTKWQNYTSTFPHFIAVDMGESHPINGISLMTRNDGSTAKPKAYEVYLSQDGENWSVIQAMGEFMYDNVNAAGQEAGISFGAVDARYFKIVFNSNYSNNAHIAIAELYATEISGGSDCVATGQNNQVMTFDPIEKKYSTDPPFELVAEANTGLPVTFSVVSGPATVSGNTVTLTGDAGIVTVKAEQVGNDDYYPVEQLRSFEVVNLSQLLPQVVTRISSDKPIEMPSLMAYPLTASAAIDEPETLEITGLEFHVDGQVISTDPYKGYFIGYWIPDAYGTHDIEIVATASNGNTMSLVKTVEVVASVEDQMVQTFEDAVINFDGTGASQWYYDTYTLPQSVGAYNKIFADFSVSCPNVNGGCDDWDRLAWVEIKDQAGEWIELFRYITPYGIACDHSIDVTDYQFLLQGEVEFRAYIETWGTGGWSLDLTLDYEAGEPEYPYSLVDEVWQGNYNFGNFDEQQPVEAATIMIPEFTESMSFRLVTTGHGWGQNNTDNAAEFYEANHHFLINGEQAFTQHLWTTCNPNPDSCNNQNGTWYYNRAGWCPGTIPAPYFYDLDNYVNAGVFNFKYIFQESYFDYCNASNPDCVSGQTCTDCNDGYNPYYRIGGYMIYKGTQPLPVVLSSPELETPDIFFTVYPNTNDGTFNINMEADIPQVVVEIYDISGRSLKNYYFKNSSELRDYTFNLHVAPGVYFVKAYNKDSSYSSKIIVE